MTPSEPNKHSFRSVRHPLHPQECLTHCTCTCARGRTHLPYLDVRFLDRLRVRVNDVLHVEKVVFFNVLEFLENKSGVVFFKTNSIVSPGTITQNKSIPGNSASISCPCCFLYLSGWSRVPKHTHTHISAPMGCQLVSSQNTSGGIHFCFKHMYGLIWASGVNRGE